MTAAKPHLQVVIGSVREGRKAAPVGEWVRSEAARRGDVSVELLDLKEWNLPMFALAKPPILGDYEDPHQQRWAAAIARADGFLFVSPEYNHGYTAALKNALDYLYGEWNRKPAGFVTYGGVAGARGIEQLRLVLVELRMAPLRDAVHIENASTKLKDGRFEADDDDREQLRGCLDALLWWSKALGRARREE